MSKNYTRLRMLANGPIRFAFEVTYAPWLADGIGVTETKHITLDAGTHMNRIVSTYTSGWWKRTGPCWLPLPCMRARAAEFPVEGSIASVRDTPQDPLAGRISTGLVADPRATRSAPLQTAGHALLVFKRHCGETFTYLAGAGWSKADMPTAEDWNAYLKLQLEMLEHPITMRWAKR